MNCNTNDDAPIISTSTQSEKKVHEHGLEKQSFAKASLQNTKTRMGHVNGKKICCFEGCTTIVGKEGGVCFTHGANRVIQRCSFEQAVDKANIRRKTRCSHIGCTNGVVKGGVCVTHGAKMKSCSAEGCNNQAKKGGVCVTHGAKVTHKRCSFEGCNNQVKKGGVCITHGAKTKKRCSHEGCTNGVMKGGVCVTHGATKKLCSHKGCPNHAKKGGVCITHGAKVERKRCSFEGCTNYVQKGGVCWTHGAKGMSSLRCKKIQGLC